MNLFISIHLSIYLSIQWSLMIIVYLSLSVTMCLPTNFQYFSCQPALFLSVRWSAFLFFKWCSNQHFARQIAQFLPPSLSLWNVYLARQRLSYYIVLSNLYSYTCLYLDHAFILLFFSLVLKATTSYENLVLIRSGRNSLEVWRQKGNFRPNWGSAEITPLFPKNWFELQKLGFKASTSSGFDQHWWEMDRTGKFSKQHVVFTGNSSVNLWWDLILGQVFSTCFPGRP